VYQGTFSPNDNAIGVDYLADIFSFAATDARYVRLEMTAVTRYYSGQYMSWLSMGEIAFSHSPTPVPEPGSTILLGTGVAFLLSMRRKCRT
jgi:hypothetical protein